MLKIKDNVDLKELEKFGWRKEYEYCEHPAEVFYCKDFDYIRLFVFVEGGDDMQSYINNREIIQGKFQLIFGYNAMPLELKYIQDEIDAGIVEEVSETNERKNT